MANENDDLMGDGRRHGDGAAAGQNPFISLCYALKERLDSTVAIHKERGEEFDSKAIAKKMMDGIIAKRLAQCQGCLDTIRESYLTDFHADTPVNDDIAPILAMLLVSVNKIVLQPYIKNHYDRLLAESLFDIMVEVEGANEAGDRDEVGDLDQGAAEVGDLDQGAAEVGDLDQGADEVGDLDQGAAEVGDLDQGAAEVGDLDQGAAEVGDLDQGAAEVGDLDQGADEVGDQDEVGDLDGDLDQGADEDEDEYSCTDEDLYSLVRKLYCADKLLKSTKLIVDSTTEFLRHDETNEDYLAIISEFRTIAQRSMDLKSLCHSLQLQMDLDSLGMD